MNYLETRKYIEEISVKGSILGLDSIKELLRILENPQDELKIIHFAGTNGKGSTVNFTESILKRAGYKVGKYTSPAVFDYREIFQIDGNYISEKEYAWIMGKVIEACKFMTEQGKQHPTAFEMETAAAFVFFKKNKVDIALIETGMGGETDATNVAKKVLCSVFTSIGMDHMAFLGDTVEKIAGVKAGIIKEGCPVVVAEQSKQVIDIIESVSKSKHSKCYIAKQEKFDLSVRGSFQQKNASTAKKIIEVLNKDSFNISEEALKEGIENMLIPGRFEIIKEKPTIIIDGAHNPNAAIELAKSQEIYFTNKSITYIMGVLADKDYRTVASTVIRPGSTVITVSTKGPRAKSADDLAEDISSFGKTRAAKSLEQALNMALADQRERDTAAIIAFGSLSYLGQLKNIVKKNG